MASVPDKIYDEFLKDQIDLLRLSESEKLKAEELLLLMRQDILKKIVEFDPLTLDRSDYQLRKMQKMNVVIAQIVVDNYEKFAAANKLTLEALAAYEAKNTMKIYNKVVGANVIDIGLSENKLRSIINNSMIDGQLIGDWWKNQAKEFITKFESTMKTIVKDFQIGIGENQSFSQMVSAISPNGELMGLTKANIDALVHTSILSVGDGVRQQIVEKNKDIFSGEKWVSTLDRRTSEICRALDGNIWDMEHNNIKGGMNYRRPPAHWRCRSLIIGIVKSFEEILGEKPIVKKLSNKQRASMNGPVSADMDYGTWLKTLPEKEQVEILGKTRYNLFIKGNLSMADMVKQNGNPLTIKELQKKVER